MKAFLLLLGVMPATLPAAELLSYQMVEPGVGAYPSRVIVTDRFVRMDDGVDEGDFVLFDRAERTIYSVTHDDRTVFVIPPREDKIQPPMALERGNERGDAGDMPEVAGKRPRHWRLSINGESCYNVIALPETLPGSVTALREMREVLAGEQRKALLHTPADMQRACDLALNAFHPGWSLEFGLPIQEWGIDGRGQQLMDFRSDYAADAALFQLPESYNHYASP